MTTKDSPAKKPEPSGEAKVTVLEVQATAAPKSTPESTSAPKSAPKSTASQAKPKVAPIQSQENSGKYAMLRPVILVAAMLLMLVMMITSDYWRVHSNRILQQYWGEPPLSLPSSLSLSLQQSVSSTAQAVDNLREMQAAQNAEQKQQQNVLNVLQNSVSQVTESLTALQSSTQEEARDSADISALQSNTRELAQRLDALERAWLETEERAQQRHYLMQIGMLLGQIAQSDQAALEALVAVLRRPDREKLSDSLAVLQRVRISQEEWMEQARNLLFKAHTGTTVMARVQAVPEEAREETSEAVLQETSEPTAAPANDATATSSIAMEQGMIHDAISWITDSVVDYLRSLITIRQRDTAESQTEEAANPEADPQTWSVRMIAAFDAPMLAQELQQLQLHDDDIQDQRDSLLASWQQQQQRQEAMHQVQQWHAREIRRQARLGE